MDASNPDGEYRDPALAGRWRRTVVLKRDLFSTVERGWFRTPGGDVDAVMRRIDRVPWWTRPIARHFLKREARALAVAGSIGVAPELLHAAGDALVRRFIDGVALHIARPLGDRGYFRFAREALRALHRARICHNDLAKEQNWLRGADGRAYLTDFQLAVRFRRRGPMFRIAAYEDLRHLLKHKRSYAPEALTASERRVLARKSLLTRAWMASGKRVYYWITRGIIGFTDREGGGPRLVDESPRVFRRMRRCAASPSSPSPTGAPAPGFMPSSRRSRRSRSGPRATTSPARSVAPGRRSICSSSPRCRARPPARCARKSSSSSP